MGEGAGCGLGLGLPGDCSHHILWVSNSIPVPGTSLIYFPEFSATEEL